MESIFYSVTLHKFKDKLENKGKDLPTDGNQIYSNLI